MFHTLGRMKNRVAQSPAERESDLRLRVETELLGQAEQIVVSTLAEQTQLQWLYGADVRRTTIIPPGVDTAMFYPRSAAEAKSRLGVNPAHKLLLFVGRIEPLKGVETLLRAVAILHDQGICDCGQMALSIIGGDAEDNPAAQNAELERLKALREELGIGELVTFLGQRDQDALPDYYAAAEAVIMPSHYESFGMVALEAMACGTPVIASEVGGLAFLVRDGETGFHVPDRDPEALSDRICRILTEPLLRAELGEAASAYAKGYAWPLIAEKIVGVYESVLARRRPGGG
jgi:D-inositol-3-phosphate glycosyltransferase